MRITADIRKEHLMDKTPLYARDLTKAQWRISSRSHDDEPPDNCVAVAFLDGGAVALRDSNSPGRGDLRFTAGEWAAFTAGVRACEFDS
jgi:hypothetical protein